MIVALFSDPVLRAAARRAARPDEDVVCEPDPARDAARRGFPRAVLCGDRAELGSLLGGGLSLSQGFPAATIVLDPALIRAWEADRRAQEIPRRRVEETALRLRILLDEEAREPTWVDGLIRDLSRGLGAPLPPPLKGLVRRVLEFPARYVDLGSLASLAGLSRGALKARFRRRGLDSPFLYLRWLRVLAAAHVLREGASTVEAADRLGFSSGANLCRAVVQSTGRTPTELRSLRGRGLLVAAFASKLREPAQLAVWGTLGDVFLAEVA